MTCSDEPLVAIGRSVLSSLKINNGGRPLAASRSSPLPTKLSSGKVFWNFLKQPIPTKFSTGKLTFSDVTFVATFPDE